eukprot:750247-Rhodomonas_salina.1
MDTEPHKCIQSPISGCKTPVNRCEAYFGTVGSSQMARCSALTTRCASTPRTLSARPCTRACESQKE